MFWKRDKPAPPPQSDPWNERLLARLMQAMGGRFPSYSVLNATGACLIKLHELEPEIPKALYDDLFNGFCDFFDALPRTTTLQEIEAAHEKRDEYQKQMTVPLYDLVANTGKAIMDVIAPVCWREAQEAGIFYELRKQILTNEANASGFSYMERRHKKVVGSDEYDGSPYEIVEKYCAHTPFYQLFTLPVPLRIERNRWPTHCVILAPSEWGKSQLTGMFLREAIEDLEGRAVIVLDPHGQKDDSLFHEAKSRIPPDRLVVVDPDHNPPALNLFDFGVLSERAALDTFKFLMSSLAGGLSPKQATALPHLFALMRRIPDATLVTLHEVITEVAKRPTQFKEAIGQLDDIHRKFFETLWYSGNYSETRDAMHWKLDAAIQEPAFRDMFSAKRNSIDVAQWIAQKKVVLINGAMNTLGKEGMQLFLLFFVGQFYSAGMRRTAGDKHLAMMFVDEASYVLQSPVISDIFIELRKFNCSLTVATQLWEHVGEKVRPAVLGSTGIKIVGQLGSNEAKAVAPDMGIKDSDIKALRNVPGSYAQWRMWIRSVTDKAVVVRAPYGVLADMPKFAHSDDTSCQAETSGSLPSSSHANPTSSASSLPNSVAKKEGPEVGPGLGVRPSGNTTPAPPPTQDDDDPTKSVDGV